MSEELAKTSTNVLQIRKTGTDSVCCVFARQTIHFLSLGGSTAEWRRGCHFEIM